MATTTARMAMVVYWRRMKASAPSRMAAATSCIFGVPVSACRTSRPKRAATARAMMLTATVMINWIYTSFHLAFRSIR